MGLIGLNGELGKFCVGLGKKFLFFGKGILMIFFGIFVGWLVVNVIIWLVMNND